MELRIVIVRFMYLCNNVTQKNVTQEGVFTFFVEFLQSNIVFSSS